MNKAELISALASKTGKPQTEAKAKAFLEVFTERQPLTFTLKGLLKLSIDAFY